MKGRNRRRERSVELVPAEEERLEVNESGEIGDGAEEGVVLEAQDSELVEAAKSGGGEVATEADAGENKANDAALCAFDAAPLAVVVTLCEGIQELVVEIGGGFERE